MRTPEKPNPKADKAASTLARAIGVRLKAARLGAFLSRRALAESAAVQRDTVLRAEKGDTGISLRTLVRLCRALGLDPRDVLGR